MELDSVADLNKINYWCSFIHGIQVESSEADAESGIIRTALEAPRTMPTIFYFIGHTKRSSSGKECYYLTADWRNITPQGIPFLVIRQMLLEDQNPAPLLLITDFCDCDNILGLPYVLCDDGVKAHWKPTEASNPLDWVGGEEVLHFAATEVGEVAYEFQSTGGIFTREFCNISPGKKMTLVAKSREIQGRMNVFFREYQVLNPGTPLLQQQHRIYSSHELDLNDANVLRRFYR